MPIYEYECRGCGNRFEHLLRTAQDAPQACPSCGGKKLEKAFSAFSVGAQQKPAAGPKPACASCTSGGCPYSGG